MSYSLESSTSIGAVTATQGTAAAASGAWPVKVTDGTDIALVTAAGEVNVLATAQPGVDIGDVTVNNASGAAAVNVQDGGNSLTVDGSVSVSGTVTVGGVAAHDAAISGNPVRLAGRAQTTENAVVADEDTSDLITSLDGKLINLPYAVPERFVSGVTASITGTGNTSVIASPGGSLRNYITQLLVTNGHATVGTYVNIKDGTTSIYSGYARQAGGGFALTFLVPLRLTAATALQAANETTGSDTRVSASGFIAP